jgi:hypothetical protein
MLIQFNIPENFVAVLLSFFYILSLVPASPVLAFSPLMLRPFCLRSLGIFQQPPITTSSASHHRFFHNLFRQFEAPKARATL